MFLHLLYFKFIARVMHCYWVKYLIILNLWGMCESKYKFEIYS